MVRRTGYPREPMALRSVELHPAPWVDLRDVEFGLRDLASALEGDAARLQPRQHPIDLFEGLGKPPDRLALNGVFVEPHSTEHFCDLLFDLLILEPCERALLGANTPQWIQRRCVWQRDRKIYGLDRGYAAADSAVYTSRHNRTGGFDCVATGSCRYFLGQNASICIRLAILFSVYPNVRFIRLCLS
jgi:hypothetical protein